MLRAPVPLRRADTSRARAAAERDFRPDIQGLRALAVGLVVFYHLYPRLLPGGYVGVDVFFAISGYLITSHLVRTLRRRGRVRLLDFYGRRARRLMPAAVVVLTVTWLASRVALPTTELPDTAQQIRASALYVQNWVLAHQAVDYSASDNAATPVQHFWSLSVEEQFYLVWPLMFLAAGVVMWALGRRTDGSDRGDSGAAHFGAGRGVLGVLALAVFGTSLAYSAHLTAVDQASAYFVTTTRMWELAFGGLLALLAERWQERIGRVGLPAWAGLVMVGASGYLMSGRTAFPGLNALVPVGGAVLVLACGSRNGRLGTSRLMSLPALVFLGDISYSLYLWHFPLITLWQERSGRQVGPVSGPVIAAVAVVLSWLTTKYVEDTVRLSPVFRGHSVRSVATVAVAALPVVLVSVYLSNVDTGPPPARLGANYPGAAVLAGDATVPPSAPLEPNLFAAPHNFAGYSKLRRSGCQTGQDASVLTECVFGETTNPVKTVALVGDSVAGEWFTPIRKMAEQRHWKLVTDLHSECPWTATLAAKPPENGAPYTTCHDWGATLLHALITRIKPDLVITSARPSVGSFAHPSPGPDAWADLGRGMADYWKVLQAHGIPVAAIRESPEMPFDVPDCLSRPGASHADCSAATSTAVRRNTPIVVAHHDDRAASMIDLNRYICTPARCNPVVGNIEVYIDNHHVTNTYARTIGPYLIPQLVGLPALDGS